MCTIKSLLVLAGCTLLPPAAFGQTYYVDFEKGSDSGSGSSPGSAFKHAPGDPAAAGRAKGVKLQPGDTVRFKGGVHYVGTINLPAGGAPGRPIVYDGNTAGTYGKGRAVIDGSEPLGGWKRCASAAEAAGHPDWRKIHWTHVPLGSDPFSINLHQGKKLLAIAQHPNATDPFYQDDFPAFFVKTGTRKATTDGAVSGFTDAKFFTQDDPHFYDGAYVQYYARASRVYYMKVRGYDPGAHRITFDRLKARQYRTKGAFALINGLRLIDRPGEYCLVEKPDAAGKCRVYLWPLGDGSPSGVTMSVREGAFKVEGRSHVTIRGFHFLRHGGRASYAVSGKGPAKGITVKDNLITGMRNAYRSGGKSFIIGRIATIRMYNVSHSLIEGNRIDANPMAKGMLLRKFNDSVVRNNFVRRQGSSGISFYDCHRTKLLYNTVADNRGVHANGLTVYLGCTDFLVEGNRVFNSNSCITAQDGRRLTIRNNIFDGRGSQICIAFWNVGTLSDVKVYNNVLVNASKRSWSGAIYFGGRGAAKGYVVKNNIVDGLNGKVAGEISHNLHTRKPEKLGAGGKVETDLAKIFVDWKNRDFRLRPGSPAIDLGIDMGLKTDFAQRTVPFGRAPDAGAYEHNSKAHQIGGKYRVR